MVDVIAYGEDGLTLWAISHKLGDILRTIGDNSLESSCQLYYRPSFGRRGGDNSAQFGEFDFILLTSESIILGESKWDASRNKKNRILPLRKEQAERHVVLRCYLESWFETTNRNWTEVLSRTKSRLNAQGIRKPTAPNGSRLEANLKEFLAALDNHFGCKPIVRNLLLYFYDSANGGPLNEEEGGFDVVSLPYDPGGQARIIIEYQQK